MNRLLIFILVIILMVSILSAQGKERTGWGWGGVPALNYNADEGFGYGVVGNIYNYSSGGYSPYFWTVQPQIFFTTGGKQEHWLWFDSPYILGKGIRITAELKMFKQLYNPYYGIGNEAVYNEKYIELDENEEPVDTALYKDQHYYTYYRNRISVKADFKKALQTHPNGRPLLSVLAGFGIIDTENKLNDETSKLRDDLNSNIITQKEIDGGFSNYLKFGVIHDTRDNEPAPNSGHWTDAVAELYPKMLGSDFRFVKLTITDRRYFPLSKKLVYAQRILAEKIFGEAPFYELSFFGSSYKVDEGLGGSKTIRGVFKNRFLGETRLFANLEVRYRFLNFTLLGQDFYLATNEFCDLGKVWSEEDESNLAGLHVGYGAGLHIGWNENFIVAVDMATSKETALQLYIGLGYLF